MTTLIVQGFVIAPYHANGPGVPGYDNGGYFGPVGSLLTNANFLATLTGTECHCEGSPGPITGATITINDHTLDIASGNHIQWSFWNPSPHPNNEGIGIYVNPEHNPNPPFNLIGPNISASLSFGLTSFSDDGSFYLLRDQNTAYLTSFSLQITHFGPVAIPLPDMGSGLVGLLTAIMLGLLHSRRRAEA
jgi:hypothetical protein